MIAEAAVLMEFGGSAEDIAGILSANRRVLGLMPHPERAVEPLLGSADGLGVFHSLARCLAERAR